jgi:hypothetical protein
MKLETRLFACFLAAASLSLPACGQAIAQGAEADRGSAKVAEGPPYLRGGVTSSEVTDLVKKLKDLQHQLRKGEQTYFDLLSGANASFRAANVSPREAFLDMAFEKVFIVERVPTQNKLWQPIRMSYRIENDPRSIWEVEVVLGIHGQVERVQMLNKPPAPF